MPHTALADRVTAGDPRAIARAISLVEDEAPGADAVMRALHPHAGRGLVIGITGPPGAGKSTLADQLVIAYRRTGVRVGVLAVDPSSPFSGGAILGDRVRMGSHAADPGVFIRSMASRGQLGGLARATAEAASILDAAGFDVILIETVGAGQDEVDIVRVADVCVVVSVPGAGDEVQALKAGIMEIADIFVINKADRDGADAAAGAIDAMLSLETREASRWRPPILRVVATAGTGVDEVLDAVARFRASMADSLIEKRRWRAEWRLIDLINRQTMRQVREEVLGAGEWEDLVARVSAGVLEPYALAEALSRRAQRRDAGALDHVGITTDDVEESIGLYGGLGMRTGDPEDVASQGVRVRFVQAGDARLELIEPLSAESPVAKSLRVRGAGVHHIAIRVPDLQASLDELRARGVRLIDEVPRDGAHGRKVAFIHPSSCGGVLIELVADKGAVRADR